MVDIFVRCTFPSVPSERQRQPLKSVALNENVAQLRNKVTEAFGIQQNDFDLVYCGRCMNDNAVLSNYHLNAGCTVHVLKRTVKDVPMAEPLDDALAAQVVKSMKQIIRNPASRNACERVLSKPETMTSLLNAAPSLGSDPVAMAIFQDFEILVLLAVADRETVSKMLAAHPSLGHAALSLTTTVNAEVVRAASSGSPADTQRPSRNPRVHYGLDLMSDEEDDDEMEEGAEGGGVGVPQGGAQITADFFRQAMQMVFSNAGQQQQSLAGLQQPSAAAQQPSVATGSSTTAPQQQPQPQVTEAQLQQLRDMGIQDEALARRALEMTGGNIQLALEFIFDDGYMS